jgi:DNA invertase Pin-like site-specific DNA recombinase
LQLDTSTPIGRMIFTIIAAVAEFERRRLSERMKDVNRYRRSRGLPAACGGEIAIGWKRAPGGKKTSVWVADNDTRDFCQYIYQLHDDEGMSYEKIYHKFWKHGKHTRKDGSEWSLTAIKRHHAAYMNGFPMLTGASAKSR